MNNPHPALRLTPSNSPFSFKTSTPKSPTRSPKKEEEPGLQLRKIIGATTSSSNGFDCLPSARCFAYTAGAAAVVATVDEHLQVQQRFFRARPASINPSRDTSLTWAASPSPLEPRHRALGTVREQNAGSPLATSVSTRDWPDSPASKSSTAKDRVKAATSVALSPNGKWLAVGETGYKPRVLIFPLLEGSPEVPVASLCEHMFGVHCLAFSLDNKLLASLGTVNDGFLHIWSITDRNGSADLIASNKLTTFVNAMAWVGRNLVTVGLRFIKVWRPEDSSGPDAKSSDSTQGLVTPRTRLDTQRSGDFGKSVFSPRHKTLSGKNSLLGDMLDCNYIAILPLSDNQAVVCAESGEICLLDDLSHSQSLSLMTVAPFPITAARLQGDRLLYVLGAQGQSECIDLDSKTSASTSKSRSRRQTVSPVKTAADQGSAVISTGIIGNTAVELTLDHAVRLRPITEDGKSASASNTVQLQAHNEAVLGVRSLISEALPSARFMSYSGNGDIHIWDEHATWLTNLTVPVSASTEWQHPPNEVKIVMPCTDGQYLWVGDKCGLLTLFGMQQQKALLRMRAHSAEILGIAISKCHGSDLIATAGRDRTIQLFMRTGQDVELLQTLDEHAAAVGDVLFGLDGQQLISYSADRTVVIRQAVFGDAGNVKSLAFMMQRTIVLKSSPTSFSFASDDHILVAAVDRSISRFNLKDGQCASSFKCTDNEGGEAVNMSKILHLPSINGTSCIAGVSSVDKSVRLYSEHGTLLARDWGHTEGITDIEVLRAPQKSEDSPVQHVRLVTVAADSTIFVWETSPAKTLRVPSAGGSNQPTDGALDIPLGVPLRRVISHTELSRFKRHQSIDDSEPSSPTNIRSTAQPSSPQRARRKTSRISVAQPPKLEPSSRTEGIDPSRRKSLWQRSPSPPSPRSMREKRDSMRRRSMATLRSKSSENVNKDSTSPSARQLGGDADIGSLTAATESICRTLRIYRRKLMTASEKSLPSDALRQLDHELKLTSRALSDRSKGKALDEASVSKLLDQASERIVDMLDERLKERVENEVSRKSSDGMASCPSLPQLEAPLEMGQSGGSDVDSVAGALGRVSIGADKSDSM